MSIKAIVFDVDGVIIDSVSKKVQIKEKILKKYWLYDLPWVKEILWLWVNRVVWLDMIYKIKSFDKEAVLNEMNTENSKIEDYPMWNENVIDFIKNNYDKYLFFTNTSLSKDWLYRILKSLWLNQYFKELFYYESGSKVENVNCIINKYNLLPNDILFIDDNHNHIENVSKIWVNILHFTNTDIDIEKEIEKI